MIDKHDLRMLEEEFIELAVAELTDDVDCSLYSTLQTRDARLTEIAELVGDDIASEWQNQAQAQADKHGYASGADQRIELWKDNSIQFPRLIAEINACVDISPEDWEALQESMDLDKDEIGQLFDRAHEEWETIKEKTCPTTK